MPVAHPSISAVSGITLFVVPTLLVAIRGRDYRLADAREIDVQPTVVTA